MKKNYFKYKKMLKKKGGPRADSASTSKKQSDQTRIAEEAVEESCDVLSMNARLDKRRSSDAWLHDSKCTYHMCPKE